MSDSESESHFGNKNGRSLTKKLGEWYKQFKPETKCSNELLQILNDEGYDVPNKISTLLQQTEKKKIIKKRDTEKISKATRDTMEMDVDSPYDIQNAAADDSWHSEDAVENFDVKAEICKDIDVNVIKDIEEKQKYLIARINWLMREIAIVNVRLADSITVENVLEKTANIFPIGNLTDMVEYERLLSKSDIKDQISILKRIIRGDPLNKSLSRILSKYIILEHNYEGKQGKLALNAYPKFIETMFRSYGEFESFSDFVEELKRVMKCVKNRVHKENCMNRKLASNGSSDPLFV